MFEASGLDGSSLPRYSAMELVTTTLSLYSCSVHSLLFYLSITSHFPHYHSYSSLLTHPLLGFHAQVQDPSVPGHQQSHEETHLRESSR
jgi:hypothetical protein